MLPPIATSKDRKRDKIEKTQSLAEFSREAHKRNHPQSVKNPYLISMQKPPKPILEETIKEWGVRSTILKEDAWAPSAATKADM